jgi:HK97 gp10 family phage protein
MVELAFEIVYTYHRTTGPNGGVDKIRERLAKYAPMLPSRFGTSVKTLSVEKAPFRTGVLKSSIKKTKVGLFTKVTVGAFYGIYVNYGTRYMHAQPFWEPAINESIIGLRRDMAAILHGGSLSEMTDKDA